MRFSKFKRLADDDYIHAQVFRICGGGDAIRPRADDEERGTIHCKSSVNWYEPRRCHLSTPTVAAENSVRVLPWHSIHLASESRSKPHPHHHRFSEHPQLISAAGLERSAIEQTQGAIRAPVKVDHSQSDKSQDCLGRLLQWWQSLRPQCV